jgi:hypothetical protein
VIAAWARVDIAKLSVRDVRAMAAPWDGVAPQYSALDRSRVEAGRARLSTTIVTPVGQITSAAPVALAAWAA